MSGGATSSPRPAHGKIGLKLGIGVRNDGQFGFSSCWTLSDGFSVGFKRSLASTQQTTIDIALGVLFGLVLWSTGIIFFE